MFSFTCYSKIFTKWVKLWWPQKFNNLIIYVDVLYFVIIVDMSCYYICGPILILSQYNYYKYNTTE